VGWSTATFEDATSFLRSPQRRSAAAPRAWSPTCALQSATHRGDHPEQVTLAILKALGVPAMQARRLVKVDLSPPQAERQHVGDCANTLEVMRTRSHLVWEAEQLAGQVDQLLDS
jgi:hypothetical protein